MFLPSPPSLPTYLFTMSRCICLPLILPFSPSPSPASPPSIPLCLPLPPSFLPLPSLSLLLLCFSVPSLQYSAGSLSPGEQASVRLRAADCRGAARRPARLCLLHLRVQQRRREGTAPPGPSLKPHRPASSLLSESNASAGSIFPHTASHISHYLFSFLFLQIQK